PEKCGGVDFCVPSIFYAAARICIFRYFHITFLHFSKIIIQSTSSITKGVMIKWKLVFMMLL
ncbi:hypothetical protein, partial [Viridibacillus soli]|uniref:hypothetical protein n=1 Tax=Viridibacillus soli TaxID=2798301 RepID=UPI001F279BDC